MKTSHLFAAILGFSAVMSAACGGSSNTTVNVNRTNANSNIAVVTNANTNTTGGSIANTVSNAVSSVTMPSPDEFMNEAAIGGMTEIELGKLASAKSTNPEIKKFGQMMVTDHTRIDNELKAVAAKKGVKLPTAPDSSAQSMIDKLKGESGAAFDNDYVEEMVDDHEKDVAAFQKQAQSSPDPDVKAFAAKALPTLEKHLEAIKAIQAKMSQ